MIHVVMDYNVDTDFIFRLLKDMFINICIGKYKHGISFLHWLKGPKSSSTFRAQFRLPLTVLQKIN